MPEGTLMDGAAVAAKAGMGRVDGRARWGLLLGLPRADASSCDVDREGRNTDELITAQAHAHRQRMSDTRGRHAGRQADRQVGQGQSSGRFQRSRASCVGTLSHCLRTGQATLHSNDHAHQDRQKEWTGGALDTAHGRSNGRMGGSRARSGLKTRVLSARPLLLLVVLCS